MKFIKITFLFVAVLVVAVVLWGNYSGKDYGAKQSLKISTVKKGDIQSIVTSTGRLNPINTVRVGAQISGNIKEIYVDFNTRVKKDEIIALIDPAVYGAQVAQAKAQLLRAEAQLIESRKEIDAAAAGIKSAQAQLISAQATLKETELNYNRKSDLGGMVARSDLDSALAKRDNAHGAVKVAEARVLTAKAQFLRAVAQKEGSVALISERKAALDLAEIKHQYCTIRSPIDGEVISREVDVGQTIAASLHSPVLFSIAEDLTRMQVEVDVSEADVGRIAPGQTVVFTVDAFPEKKFSAKVREVRNEATSIQNVVTYKSIADVDNKELLLRPGMTANAGIITAEVKNILKVPNGALRFKPQLPENKEKSNKKTPVRERSIYKDTVKKINLDAGQSDALVTIIEQAGQKLKTVYALPEADRNLKLAWKDFYKQVLTNLYKILRKDQHEKFRALVAERRERGKQRRLYNGRPATVYVPDETGRPLAVKITVGITDDDETQVVDGELAEGDRVIVGIDYASASPRNQNRNVFSSFFRRR